MTNISASNKLVELVEVTSAVVPIAVFQQSPAELSEQNSIEFQDGFDDLDYLKFSLLQLPSGKPTTLVYHQNSPNPGVEICVIADESNREGVIQEVMQLLNLPTTALICVHPEI
ncbi:hypothetical protein [Acaryochloris sp. CCMEE 5410]|uniref:hypothetical protein n=1 Tax=Acaryochloris sp. CCMEE 5410 TaxID=310037 RepID=UPI000248432F|nr:hypothetical protein [Acaryochloris sp. CCMEE 5410]KAI9133099.1 hypothetical protein ON05_007055 [Acaryochloris sp. CCMEE 5410]